MQWKIIYDMIFKYTYALMYKTMHLLHWPLIYILCSLNTKTLMIVVYGDGQSRICGGSCGGSDHCAWPEVTWPEVTSVTWPEVTLSGSMFCVCATGSCHISALVGPFDRKWHQSPDRKRPWPEVSLTGSMFCACPAFPRAFFFVVVQ